MSQIHLSVIIPSYNEQRNLKRGVLDEVAAYLDHQKYTWEVILSDDGSSDGTTQLLEEFATHHPGFKVLANQHSGKGPTVQAGMLAAQGEWRLFTDFDQSTPLSEVEKLWPFITDHQVIIGSREMVGSRRDSEPWYRHYMGRGFNWLVQMLAVPGILDTQCGFKMFSATAAEKLFKALFVYGRGSIRHDAFTGAFDVELLYLALKWGLPVAEVPIAWHHHFTDRVSPVKDSLRMLRDIVRVRMADTRGVYAASR